MKKRQAKMIQSKKKIFLKEKEAQLDKINEQLQRSTSYIMGKHDNKKKMKL